jgi:hypothetical protein
MSNIDLVRGTGKKRKREKAVKLDRPFTFLKDYDKKSSLLKEITEKDMQGMTNPLQLMKSYEAKLSKKISYGNIDKKLDWLFLNGRVPKTLDGYYHGITVGMKTGFDCYTILDLIRSKFKIGKDLDPTQLFHATLLSKSTPWAGKNFKKLTREKVSELTDGFEKGNKTAYMGINSFRNQEKGILNNIGVFVLPAIIETKAVPAPTGEKQSSYIYGKGGLFITTKEKTVDIKNPDKEVMALNYRWTKLDNKLPNTLLVDEIVEISKGLCLGKLYFATDAKSLYKDYDPSVDKKAYKYRNFGYFLLMDDTWLHEKNMLFPELAYKMADDLPAKFTTFCFEDAKKGKAIKVKARLSKERTVLHYLRDLSDGVREGALTEEKYFNEVQNLFMNGERPDGIEGYLRGGVVALKRGGFMRKFSSNVTNDLYPAIRLFSPWTGKTFKDVGMNEAKKYIGKDAEYYKDKGQIVLGTNTFKKNFDLSLPATAFIEQLDKIGMVVEQPTKEEKAQGVDLKSFYFMAHFTKSIMKECKGKGVLQFNYRWPKFRTMVPDCYCIDELVRVADGLYLGQLLYATDWNVPYDPKTQPFKYKYDNFGYFLLMDGEWQAMKEFMGFDMNQVL